MFTEQKGNNCLSETKFLEQNGNNCFNSVLFGKNQLRSDDRNEKKSELQISFISLEKNIDVFFREKPKIKREFIIR